MPFARKYVYQLGRLAVSAIASGVPEAVTRILDEFGFSQENNAGAGGGGHANLPPLESYLNLYDVLWQAKDIVVANSASQSSDMTTNAFHRLYPKFLTDEAMEVGGAYYWIALGGRANPEQVLERIRPEDKYNWRVYAVLARATLQTVIDLAKKDVDRLTMDTTSRIVGCLEFEEEPKYNQSGPCLFRYPLWRYARELLLQYRCGKIMAPTNAAIIFRAICPAYMTVESFVERGNGKSVCGVIIDPTVSTAEELWTSVRRLEPDTICLLLSRVIERRFGP